MSFLRFALVLLTVSCTSRVSTPIGTPVCPSHTCPPSKGTPPALDPEELPPKLVLRRTEFTAVPGWTEDKVVEAIPPLLKSCFRLMKRSDDRLVGRDETGGFVRDWRVLCAAAKGVAVGDVDAGRAFFETHFTPFLAHNNDTSEGGFTGYYEASMRGARKRRGRFQTPLYKRPADLVMVNLRNFMDNPGRRRIAGRVVNGLLKSYYTRQQIRDGALEGKELELVWIDNPVDGFFTQIQGSGMVHLEDGSKMRIGYAGQNGHPYVAIGREMVREGHITREEMSMQAIRKWLADNPESAGEMMNRNSAYVFFAKLDGDGPVGSQNVPLTAERSCAIDRNFIPQSVPLFVDTTVPNEDGSDMRVFQQLVIAQDSGGAIRGPVRADIFWGHGDRAAAIAGRLKSRGRYFMLLPKAVAERMSP